MWEVSKRDQSPHLFQEGSAFATMSVTNWMRLRLGNWWIGRGSGWIDQYYGNADAAQLWIDLHSGNRSRLSYEPMASNQSLSAEWYGVGRSVPVRLGSCEGLLELNVRSLVVRDYLDRTVIGSVAGDGFSAIARVISSESGSGAVLGRGWCVDTRVGFKSKHWRGQMAVEGLHG